MLVRILKLLQDEHLKFIDDLLASASFVDGGSTTGSPTRQAKNNQQLDLGKHPKQQDFLRMMSELFLNHPMILSAAYPKRMTMPLISRYAEGQSYGWHIDNPLMPGPGGPVRADIACTVFLTDGKDYDGGELHIRSHAGDIKVKLDRGDVILYPATNRHEVTPVTRGSRLAMVFWLQSMVAEASDREILYDMDTAYRQIYADNPNSEALQVLQRAQANLMRKWAEN